MWLKTCNDKLVDTSKMYKITFDDDHRAAYAKVYGHFELEDDKILLAEFVKVNGKTPKALEKYLEKLAKKLGAEEI